MPDTGAAGQVVIATIAVWFACRCAERIAIEGAESSSTAPSRVRCLVLRTLVPAACLVAVATLRECGGIRWAGLFSTFPGMTLAVLIVTYLEASPAEAGRMAKALPSANFGMVAFIAAFRFGCPALGLGWGTAGGYALAVATLFVVGGWTRRTTPAVTTPGRPRVIWPTDGSTTDRTVWLGAALSFAARRPEFHAMHRTARPLHRRRLSPLVEPIGL